MYYEEQWVDGALCWRTSPDGAWTRYTANELAHRYESAEKRAADAQATVEALQAVIRQMGEQAAVLAKDGMAAKAQVAALQARVTELEESRDAWRASQECSEKAYMALVNQIPAERFDYDPVNVALLDGAKEQEIIGRKQIADLQDLLKRTDENREQWRKLCQEAQSQLTQRTAELEAATRERDEAIREHGKESGFWGRSCARLLDKRDELQAALTPVEGGQDE